MHKRLSFRHTDLDEHQLDVWGILYSQIPRGAVGWVNHVATALVAAGAAKIYSIPAAPQ